MKISLSMGAFAPKISEQLAAQGLSASEADIKRWALDAECITHLRIRGLLSDAEGRKASQRLLKIMAKRVMQSATRGEDGKNG